MSAPRSRSLSAPVISQSSTRVRWKSSSIEKYIGVKHGGLGPGSVQMGSDGQPNGRLNNLEGIVPLPEPDTATMRRSVETGIRRVFTSKGVTTICELSDTLEPRRCCSTSSTRAASVRGTTCS